MMRHRPTERKALIALLEDEWEDTGDLAEAILDPRRVQLLALGGFRGRAGIQRGRVGQRGEGEVVVRFIIEREVETYERVEFRGLVHFDRATVNNLLGLGTS